MFFLFFLCVAMTSVLSKFSLYIAMSAAATEKSLMLYKAIDDSNGFYSMVVEAGVRSRVNVPFRIYVNGKEDPDSEARFIKEASATNIVHIKGHRTVGGLRASLYNAVSVKDTQFLIDFMEKFAKNNA